jgi:hypothetical protein
MLLRIHQRANDETISDATHQHIVTQTGMPCNINTATRECSTYKENTVSPCTEVNAGMVH